jgi:hypothetical protein
MHWRYPAQEQNYLDNPAMLDYEKQLGHSKLNFTDYDEFLRVTDPQTGTRNQESGIGQQGSAEATAPPPDKPAPLAEGWHVPRPKKHATKQQVQERLAAIHTWMLDGMDQRRLLIAIRTFFGLGKRMAQIYIKRVKDGYAEEASQADYLAHLWISKLQHEELAAKARDRLPHCADHRVFATVLRGCLQALKARDTVMASILEHRARTKRDTSPDSRQARAHRSRQMVMPVEEFWERLEHLRNSWWWEWNQEQMQKEDAAKLLREQAAQPAAGGAAAAEKPIAN